MTIILENSAGPGSSVTLDPEIITSNRDGSYAMSRTHGNPKLNPGNYYDEYSPYNSSMAVHTR